MEKKHDIQKLAAAHTLNTQPASEPKSFGSVACVLKCYGELPPWATSSILLTMTRAPAGCPLWNPSPGKQRSCPWMEMELPWLRYRPHLLVCSVQGFLSTPYCPMDTELVFLTKTLA